MKKILHIFIVFLLGLSFLRTTTQVQAEQCPAPINGLGVTIPESPLTESLTITIDLSSNWEEEPPKNYELVVEEGTVNQAKSVPFKIFQNVTNVCNNGEDCITVKDGVVTWTITSVAALTQSAAEGGVDTHTVDLNTIGEDQCDVGTYDVTDVNNPGPGCTVKVYQNRNGEQCYLNESQSACFADDVAVIVEVSELKSISGTPWNDAVGLRVGQGGAPGEAEGGSKQATNGKASLTFVPNSSSGDDFFIQVEDRDDYNELFPNCEFTITTTPGCNKDQCEPETELEIGTAPASVAQEAFSLCKQIPEEQAEQRSACEACTGGEGEFEGNEGVWTAIGCINREPRAILQKFITVGLGMSGGVALLTFLAAGFIFSTSQGDPKAYGKAKEMMTASIVGILFVIFSITILQFIGYEILKIPGFGGA